MITDIALLSACEKSKQPERALEPLEAMQQQGAPPCVLTYSASISACEYPERGLGIFEVMQQRSLESDVLTYNALMSACEKDT